METAPEVPKCFGMCSPKVATYFIAIFGLGCGGLGLAGIILYGLVEDSVVAQFFTNNPINESVKKVVLMTLGLSSLMLFISNVLLFTGIVGKQDKALLLGAWILFVLCTILICGAVGLPVICFFWADTCVLKKISSSLLAFGYMFVTFFLWIWLYFMVVVFNLLNELEG